VKEGKLKKSKFLDDARSSLLKVMRGSTYHSCVFNLEKE
jgi:hypothetical protein